MSRLQCLKVLPLRCVRKKKSEQIIRIYAGFYQFIGALVKYCLFYGLLQVTNLEFKQVPSVCSVVCLITSLEPCCPTKKQQIYKFN